MAATLGLAERQAARRKVRQLRAKRVPHEYKKSTGNIMAVFYKGNGSLLPPWKIYPLCC